MQLSLIVTPANAGRANLCYLFVIVKEFLCAFAYSWHLVVQLQNNKGAKKQLGSLKVILSLFVTTRITICNWTTHVVFIYQNEI